MRHPESFAEPVLRRTYAEAIAFEIERLAAATLPPRPYVCLTCEVSTPPMTLAEAAALRAEGHELEAA